ncbi:hypothetical protein SBI_10021 [Streptomyces bingchenggensis BCW-1]|uniref:Uncharacterized protein n=1 Tax=Streptomyces bingchenggensis (strain BCW-1) TaxID=749414 RepID=D7CFC3_STRBB|nr:hypothetical protein SBI_10021 [Streptomyces bingchenggensis BCW-1]
MPAARCAPKGWMSWSPRDGPWRCAARPTLRWSCSAGPPTRGAGTGQYLRAILDAFLNLGTAHFTLGSDVLCNAHVVAAVGQERIRAEVVPLYLRAAGDASNARPDQ